MAKEVIWSGSALRDRLDIYLFWLNHNQSSAYSDKLELLFEESARIIAHYPEIGPVTDFKDVRVKMVRDYKIFYRASKKRVEILRVWNTHQDPDQLQMK